MMARRRHSARISLDFGGDNDETSARRRRLLSTSFIDTSYFWRCCSGLRYDGWQASPVCVRYAK